jgi:hypothetical protein
MKKANSVLWKFMRVCANRRKKDAMHVKGAGGAFGTGHMYSLDKRSLVKKMSAEEKKIHEEKEKADKERDKDRDEKEIEAEKKVDDFH